MSWGGLEVREVMRRSPPAPTIKASARPVKLSTAPLPRAASSAHLEAAVKRTSSTVRLWPTCVLGTGGQVAQYGVDGRSTAACSTAALARPRKSEVCPSRSTARYRYFYRPPTRGRMPASRGDGAGAGHPRPAARRCDTVCGPGLLAGPALRVAAGCWSRSSLDCCETWRLGCRLLAEHANQGRYIARLTPWPHA